MQRRQCGILIAALFITSSRLHAAEAQVSVRLDSGRSLTGVLDSRTSDEKLWLRWRVGEVELQRPIAWHRIKSVELGGEAVDVHALQERAASLATPGRETQLRRASADASPQRTLTPSSVVASIQCDAWLANCDGDAEFDGLMLEVVALNQFGEAIAAQGTVEAELITIDYQPAYLNSTSGGRVPTSIGRWNQAWKTGEKLRLELLGRHPQRDRNLDRYALLRVRVSIPGSGVLEQEIDGLRTRPFTPLQNQLWR